MAHQLIHTPHPLVLADQRRAVMEFVPGESLYALMERYHVKHFDADAWVVAVGGRVVPCELWHHIRPKDGQLIEVRRQVNNNQIWAYIAIAVLSYFTLGAGGAAGGSFLGLTGVAAYAAAAAVFIVGATLINKVLGPKASSPETNRDSIYNLTGQRNTSRPYEPLGLLLGEVYIAPDIASNAYTWYEGDDQFLGMVLTPGLNCDRIGDLYNGDALLSNYEGVTVNHNGYSGMSSSAIPLYTNADTVAGGTLEANEWVVRTTSTDTRIIQIDLEYQLYDKTTKGKDKKNQERVTAEYSPVGLNQWSPLGQKLFTNSDTDTHRYSMRVPVEVGQYDVRVRRDGIDTDGSGANIAMNFTQMLSVQVDETDYTGIPRTAITMKATGQLNNAPDEIRTLATAKPMPIWNGTAWGVATQAGSDGLSNPGAQGLQFVRGFYDERNKLVAGYGYDDTMIDIPSWQAFMLHCQANGFRYDFWLRDKRSKKEALDAILLAGFGKISWSSGKMGVVFSGADQPYVKVFNMANIKSGSFRVDYTLDNAADGIEYTYYDRAKRDNVTLRIPFPGIDPANVINPATVTGEGVGDEDHAAKLARYHMAQNAYQWRDITLSTDIEHVTCRELDIVQLSHDLTQWGYSGRIMSARIDAGVTVLTLDATVPARDLDSWIGLRIPGEETWRVFKTEAFEEDTDELRLVAAWPSDAPLPGSAADNPAWDTLWCFDFKATPGFSARVVSIQPEDDLSGASISVVPESAEFWTYVNTGIYVPSQPGTGLLTKPVLSGLKISEQHIVQGNTVFTNLTAAWDVAGPYDYAVVLAAEEDAELKRVAQTIGAERTATWRIPSAGVYNILVRPYSPNGDQGVPVSIQYVTQGADAVPNNFDNFDVVELGGGIRRYTWGYDADTIQPPNLAGAEIRYILGSFANPVWDDMAPVGEDVDGFHTVAFEAATPPAGQYTFGIRALNTNGALSNTILSIIRTLTKNVGEKFTDVEQAQNELNLAITKEIQDRLNADAEYAAAAAADAQAKANAARDAAIAHADVIGAQVADIIGADEWLNSRDYPAGDLVKSGGNLYRALQEVPAGTPVSDAAYWQLLGQYDSLGEAVAASISVGNQNTSDIAAEAAKLDAVQARMPTGTGQLATSALVADEATARASADAALGTRTSTVEARMPTGTDKLANEARVVTAENASVSRDNALGSRVDSVQAKLPADGGQAASSVTVTSFSQASVDRDNALGLRVDTVQSNVDTAQNTATTALNTANSAASAITSVSSRTSSRPNILPNGDFASGLTGVNNLPTNAALQSYVWGNALVFSGAHALSTNNVFSDPIVNGIAENITYTLSADMQFIASSGTITLDMIFYNGAGTTLQVFSGTSKSPSFDFSTLDTDNRIPMAVTGMAPAGTASMRWRFRWTSVIDNISSGIRYLKLERGSAPPTPYSNEAQAQGQATATQALTTSVNNLTGAVNAKYTLALNVNGYVSGITSVNNGTTSTFDVVADTFRIVAPSGGARYEYSANNVRIYDANGVLRVRMGVW